MTWSQSARMWFRPGGYESTSNMSCNLSTSKESLLIFSGCLTAWTHGWCRATNPIKFTGTLRQTMSVSSAEVIWLNPSWVYTLIISGNMPLQLLNFPAEERALQKKIKSKTPMGFTLSDVCYLFLFDSYLKVQFYCIVIILFEKEMFFFFGWKFWIET